MALSAMREQAQGTNSARALPPLFLFLPFVLRQKAEHKKRNYRLRCKLQTCRKGREQSFLDMYYFLA
jgi:hypothetical protein